MRTLLGWVVLLLMVNPWMHAQTYFPPIGEDTWETVAPATLGYVPDSLAALDDFLANTNSQAFLLLQDGRIVHEAYYNGFAADDFHQWNSSGKSLNAVLTGTVIENGNLSLDDPVGDYLGVGWTSCTEQEEARIQIRHLLSMTSGLNDRGDSNCTEPACLTCIAVPGERWAYHTAATTRLLTVLEEATGQNLIGYTNDVFRSRVGLTGFWRTTGFNRIFVSNARSFARWGLLVTNNFVWDGTPLLTDPSYVAALTSSSQAFNPSYGYLFWLNGQDGHRLPGINVTIPGPLSQAAPSDAVLTLGKNGQISAAYPAQGLTWVRFGTADPEGAPFVGSVYANQIAERIARLQGTSSATEIRSSTLPLSLKPNPAVTRVEVSAEVPLVQVRVLGLQGQVMVDWSGASNASVRLHVDALAVGVYVVEGLDQRGGRHVERLVVE